MRLSAFTLECSHQFLLYTLTLLVIISTRYEFVHSQAFAPSIAYSSSSVFIEGQGLYVQGGYDSSPTTAISQSFMIDLSKPWNVSNPIYSKLTNGTPAANAVSVLSADKQNWFIMANSSGYTYNFQTSKWTSVFASISFNPLPGLAGAADPNTGLIYIPNGQLLPTGQAMLRVNLGTNTWDSVPMFGGLDSLAGYSVAWSSIAKGMFMFGGKVNGTINNLLLQYNSVWSTPTTSGSSPSPRSSACFVPAYNATTMVLFGGILNQGLPASDIYFLNLTTMAWTRGPDAGTADVRSSSSCAVTGDYFISWGGFDGSFPVRANSTIVYNMKTNTWVSTFGSPLIPSATSSVAPSTTTATKTTSTSTTTASSTPTPTSSVPSGAIAAGVTIPVVFVVVFVVFIRHRKHQREQREASTTNNTSHVDDTLDEVKGSYPTDTVVELKDNGEDYIKQKQRFSQFRGPATEYYQRFLSAVRNPSTGNQGADVDREAFSQNRLHRFSHLRGPATEGDPFGNFQRLFPTTRDPSTTDVGTNDDRRHRFSHLRGPSASPSEHEQQLHHSERPRNPNTGENLFANIQRFSHLRGPSTTGTTATTGIHQNDQYHDDDDDWAQYYNNANWLEEEEQNDYIPPPPPTSPPMPPRPKKSRFPMPLGHPVNTERGLPNRPPVARHSTRRAPATFERESTFRYMDSIF